MIGYHFLILMNFIHLKNNKTIQEFLSDERYKTCQNVKINWLCYTDNGLVYYDNRTLEERFPKYKIDFIDNKHIKSTVRGNLPNNYWATHRNPHTSKENYTSCDNRGKIIAHDTPFNPPTYDYAFIKHYCTKTIEEFCMKTERGYPDQIVRFTRKYWIRKFGYFFALSEKTKEKLDYIKRRYNIDYK